MFKGLRFFLRSGWKYDKRYIIYLVLNELLTALIPIAAALMPKFIVDELMGAQRVGRLLLYVGLFAGYAMAAGALSSFFGRSAFTHRVIVNMEFDLAQYARLAEADYGDLERPAFRDMKEKANKFLTCDWHGFGYLLDCALRVCGQALTLAGLAAILSTLTPLFVLLFVGLALLSAWAESRAKKRAAELNMEMAADQRGVSYYDSLFDDIKYGKEIRLNGLGAWLLRRARGYRERVNARIAQTGRLFIRSAAFRSVFTFIQQGAAYAFVIFKVIAGDMTVGDFTMYAAALTAFAEALRQVMDSVTEILTYDMYYENLDEFLNLPRRLRAGKGLPVPNDPHELTLEDVGFRYPGAEGWALRHISLTIRPGEKLAVAGENGSGKTTLIKLLCRLYDPTEGAIRMDGVDIRDMDYDAYMAMFSTVFQDFQLFDFPLRDNIALGRPANDAGLRALLERVGLGALPHDLDTHVGRRFDEQGFLPSGGEAQNWPWPGRCSRTPPS